MLTNVHLFFCYFFPPIDFQPMGYCGKASAKDVMHLFEVSSVSEAHAIHIGRGWKR